MTVGELIESLERPHSRLRPWARLLGPNGGVISAWSGRANLGATEEWAIAYEVALAVRADLDQYVSTLGGPVDADRLHRNLCALLAIRANQIEDANRHVKAGQASYWSRSHHRRHPTFDKVVMLPVGMRISADDADIVQFRIAALSQGPAGVWEDPEVALTPLTPDLLQTVAATAPAGGSFAWRIFLKRDITDTALSGTSCGGALRLGFQILLRERAEFDTRCLVLADPKLDAVGGLKSKIDAAFYSDGQIRRVLLGRGSVLDPELRRDWEKRLELIPIASEAEAFAIVANHLLHSTRKSEIDDDLPGVVKGECPYVGPQSFSIKEADRYFRREKDWQPLVATLRTPGSVVLLHAPSGTGKSSLLNTNLRLALEAAGVGVLPVARVIGAKAVAYGGNPFTATAIASMEQQPLEAPLSWRQYLSSLPPNPAGRLLILDQLEEIASTTRVRDAVKQEFFGEIRDALRSEKSLRVLFSFRDEWLGEIQRLIKEYDPDFYERTQTYALDRFWFADAKKAIEQPALQCGVRYDAEVVEDIITELRKPGYMELEEGDYKGLRDYVEPLQLQLVCTLLWNRLPQGSKRISMQQVREVVKDIPSQGSAIATLVAAANELFYNDVVNKAAAAGTVPNHKPYPRTLIELGLGQFIEDGKFRTFVIDSGEFTGDLPTPVVEEMARLFLLNRKNLPAHRMFELAHDRLIEPVRQRAVVSDENLQQLFRDCIFRVAEACAIDPGVLEAECLLALVSPDGTRIAVTMDAANRSTWLPWKALEKLERAGILRSARENSEAAFELSHPAMARALLSARNSAFGPRHRVRRNLGNYLEAAHREFGPELKNYFPDVEIVAEIHERIGFGHLTLSEATFTLRASLGSGDLVEEAIGEIYARCPEITATTLLDGTRFQNSAAVRANAARGLKLVPLDHGIDILHRMAIDDSSSDVRRMAALSLAAIDQRACWEPFLAFLGNPDTKHRAALALAWIKDTGAPYVQFTSWWVELPKYLQSTVERSLRGIRGKAALPRIAIGTAVASLSTILFVAPLRAVLGLGGYTITQLSTSGANGFVESGFLGIVGAIIWNWLICGAILSWWYIAEGRQPFRTRSIGIRTAIVGALSGLLGGVLISLTITYVYGPASLRSMGWLVSDNPSDSLTRTGLGYGMPFSGMIVGATSAIALIQMLPRWETAISKKLLNGAHGDVSDFLRTYIAAFRHSLRYSPIILVPQILGALAFWLFLQGKIIVEHNPGILGRLIGDYVDVAFGGVGLTAGILLGLFVVGRGFERGGIHVEGRPEYSLMTLTSTHTDMRKQPPIK